ncbi:hypothetical protein HOY82DRAFT_611249 [Tuber indicum]|nr:hypothetical protein HOY82DRAFT_611249 [Tuber indicum]
MPRAYIGLGHSSQWPALARPTAYAGLLAARPVGNTELALKLANPAATVICAGFLYYSQKNIEAQIIRVKNDLQAQITGVGKDLNEARIDLTKGINQLGIMQERLKAFAACVRGGGGDDCILGGQGKGPGAA